MPENVLRALVVDDNFYNRNLCLLALEHVGIASVEAENGQEALDLLDSQPFDLLLLDLAMPLLDGRAVIQKLEEKKLLDQLTIVVITAHSHLASDINDLADFVMYKPIDIQLFTQFIQRLEIR